MKINEIKKAILTSLKESAKSICRFFDAIPRTLSAGPESKVKYRPGLQTENKVCVVLDRGMGDFILFAYYLKKLMEYYASRSEELWIIADTYNVEFLRHYIPEALDRTIILERNGLRTVDGVPLLDYRGMFGTAILPMNYMAPRTCEILRLLSPGEIFPLRKKRIIKNYSLLDYAIFKRARNFHITENFSSLMYREFLQILCGEDYGFHLMPSVSETKMISRPYFAVNVEASNVGHLPTFECFLALSKSLASYYHFVPVIMGQLSAPNMEAARNQGCIVNFANRRNLQDAISLCQYAEFVLTAETGIYHLAMSIPNGPPVLAPTWACHDIPYVPYPDEVMSENRLLYVRKYSDCKDCRENKLRCSARRVITGKTVACISEFKAEDMFEQARAWLDSRLRTGGAL